MDREERKQWSKATSDVKLIGIKLLTIDMFTFKILESNHPQADELNYIVRDIKFDDLMGKLTVRR